MTTLRDSLETLFCSFPGLADAFEPDDLPIAFILQRDRPGPRRRLRTRRRPTGARTAADTRTVGESRRHRSDARSALRANRGGSR